MLLIAAVVVAGLAAVVTAVAFWSLGWPRVKGTVEESDYEETWRARGGGRGLSVEKEGRFQLKYTYSVDGVTYHGTRISPLLDLEWQVSNAPDLGNAKRNSQIYRQGTRVDVAYCPHFPKWACLEPGGFLTAILLGVIATVLALID